MIETIISDTENNFEWIDVVAPTADEYKELSEKYHLHPASVKDCLSPMHLPKYEKIDDTIFMITRIYDVHAQKEADDIQKLTNKVAFFLSDRFLVTIHRKDEPFLVNLKDKWKGFQNISSYSPHHVVNQLLHEITFTFAEAIRKATERLDDHEKLIFEGTKSPKLITDLYIVKRRASVFKRMLFLTRDSLDKFGKFSGFADPKDPFMQDVIENADTLFFQADELHENTNNLLNLHLSLSSHRTNEVMGVLTIISLFFLPQTFIVGLYGMNFKYMPELNAEYGYHTVIAIMVVLGVLTYYWTKKKGWW